MAYNESEVKEGKEALERRNRLLSKAGQLINYCTKCKKSFKNEHGLMIHNSVIHKNAKLEELEGELANLKNDPIHPVVHHVMNGKVLQEILDLSESLNLTREQIIQLIKFKKEKKI